MLFVVVFHLVWSMLECEFACLKTEYDRDLKTLMNDIIATRSRSGYVKTKTKANGNGKVNMCGVYAKRPVIPI